MKKIKAVALHVCHYYEDGVLMEAKPNDPLELSPDNAKSLLGLNAIRIIATPDMIPTSVEASLNPAAPATPDTPSSSDQAGRSDGRQGFFNKGRK